MNAYPDCPNCQTDVFVERSKGPRAYTCQRCAITFEAPLSFDAERGRQGDV